MDGASTFRALSEEYCEAVTLPSKVVSERTCSDLVKKLLTKRKQEHELVLDQMKTSFNKVNEDVTEEIWLESKAVKAHVNRMENEIESLLDKAVRNYQQKLVELEVDAFVYARTAIRNHEKSRSEIIDQFYRTLKDVELKRSNAFKVILKDSYAKLGRVSFKLPNELLEFFETEILKINEITLDNHRHYLDLYTELKLQTEDYARSLFLEIQEMEDKYSVAVKKATVKDLIGRNILSYEVIFDVDSAGDDKDQMTTKISINNVPSMFDLLKTTTDTEAWSKQVQESLDVLDNNARKLVDLYRMAVVNIFNRFFEELQNISDLLMEDVNCNQPVRDDCVQSEVSKPIIEDITQQYTYEVTDLQKLWNSMTAYMQSNIENTHTFLRGSSHLWDAHFDRVNLARSLVLQDLKNRIDKNDRTAQNFEKKINRTVDMLRQASTPSKLDLYLKEVNSFLDSIGKMFHRQCDEEIKTLNKYHALVKQEIDVLLAEIERFLSEFDGKQLMKNIRSFRSGEATADEEHLVPQQMRACKYQVDAVNNWMLGLWEAVRMYMMTCRKELSEQAAEWVNNQVNKLRKRLEVRVAVHKPRYERIKHTVYDVRRRELEDHSVVMDRIRKAVDETMAASRQSNRQCRDEQMALLDGFGKELDEVKSKAKVATRSLQILSYIERTQDLIGRTRRQFEDNFRKNREELDGNLIAIKRTIEDVGASIKLFSEGGNYSHEEAKMFVKQLAKANRTLPKTYSKVFGEADAITTEILKEFEVAQSDLIARLGRSKRELEHNEASILKMRKLRSDIRRKVHAVRYEQAKIEASIDYFSIMSTVNLWKQKNFESMKNALIDCLNRITTLTAYLIWRRSHSNITDDASILPTAYVTELDDLIRNSRKEMAEIAEIFYREHGPIVNEGKVQPTYEAFVEEVSKKYEAYERQVKINGLEMSEDLIGQILKLLKINDRVYEELVKKYRPRGRKDEEFQELYRKLSRGSSDLQTRRRSLVEKQEEEVEELVNPNVKDLLRENSHREGILHDLINKLFDHVKDKMEVMKEHVFGDGEESKKLEQSPE